MATEFHADAAIGYAPEGGIDRCSLTSACFTNWSQVPPPASRRMGRDVQVVAQDLPRAEPPRATVPDEARDDVLLLQQETRHAYGRPG